MDAAQTKDCRKSEAYLCLKQQRPWHKAESTTYAKNLPSGAVAKALRAALL